MKNLSSIGLSTIALASAVSLLASCADLPAAGTENNPCNDKGHCRKGLVCGPEGICLNPAKLPHEDGGTKDGGGNNDAGGADGSVTTDSGQDSGPDTGTDAGTDTGLDAASDATSDAETDAQVDDAGADGGTLDDAGIDAAIADGGTDASTDTGADDTGAVTDAGSDTGIEVDASETDASGQDIGPTDTGAADTGNADAGASDGGSTDTGTTDAGCTPDCTNKCGGASADGCGGTCSATCSGGLVCQGGGCVHAGDYGEPCGAGDACNAPATCNLGTCVSDTCGGKGDFTLCKKTEGTPDRSYDICVNETCVSPGCGDATCNTPGPHFTLPDTNQRKCYDGTTEIACTTFPCDISGAPQFCGQDAQYGWDKIHTQAERYNLTEPIAGRPIVIDGITSLIWQGCAAGLTGIACDGGSLMTKGWTDAIDYCNTLSWSGFNDWRLPDPYELQTIVDYGRGSPSIDTVSFPSTPSTVFATSTTVSYSLNDIRSLDFDNGRIDDSSKTSQYNVRCVRGIPISHSIRFVSTEPAAGQVVVADNGTGLIWQACAAGLSGTNCATGIDGTYSWSDALSYCESLNWGGVTNWRLPNSNELNSLIDYRRSGPSIDVSSFPATPLKPFWSSSTYIKTPNGKWDIQFATGTMGASGIPNTRAVRCVRDGMVQVPAGPFMMGCNSAVDTECLSTENPYHSVNVPAFKSDKYEVTSAEYKSCVTGSGCTPADTGSGCNYNLLGKESHPINCVDWDQAKAYCAWAGKRLPTEAEWEKAARGTDGRKYPWGNDSLDCDHAVMSANPCSNTATLPVGSKPLGVSPYGAEDMVGNVYEWVDDDWHGTYTGAPADGTPWIDAPRGGSRVGRGGSWNYYTTSHLRASYRLGPGSASWNDYLGFRCAVSL